MYSNSIFARPLSLRKRHPLIDVILFQSRLSCRSICGIPLTIVYA